ncbi:MAG: hypothetical protein JW715_11965, partial [Sedimentisphaerales bacterium]|nr:hypothetical protein [Sedimentisphaerales bacterium]
CFFGLSFIGWINDLSPYVCCKRAIAGAAIVYIASSIAVKAVNAILIDAMIMNRLDQQDKSKITRTNKIRPGDIGGGGNS